MSISLSHLLHGLFRRHHKTLVASPDSVATPLGQVGYRRIVDTLPSTKEGMRRAMTREYAIKPKERNHE